LKNALSALKGQSGSWSPMEKDNQPEYQIKLPDTLSQCDIRSFSIDLTNVDKLTTEVKFRRIDAAPILPAAATVSIFKRDGHNYKTMLICSNFGYILCWLRG
jgi:hypothetical protein